MVDGWIDELRQPIDGTQRRVDADGARSWVGHFRYWLEAVGPELRQYIVTDNDEERPFSRDQRRWIYAAAKRENNYFGFGSDNDMELRPSYLIIKHDSFHWKSVIPVIRSSIRSSGFRAPR